jgi:nitrite reductase/ring-hydroxylating ferredoxin subunit
MARHVVARADEIQPGERKRVTAGGRAIAIFNVDGELFAIRDRCPHQGASLCGGQVLGWVESDGPGDYRHTGTNLVQCPWHGWEFDLRSGRSWFDPARMRVRAYPVAVERGQELLEGPYRAETYPVAVDGDYVVVELG